MELRVLEYFLAVAREESISGAAQFLHLSQPTLSRQLKELETSLGKQLFLRGKRKITLTEEGRVLRKRAEEILELVHRTEREIARSEDLVSGDVYIGAGETVGMRYLTRAAYLLQREHPGVRFHVSSGDSIDVYEQLDRGLVDFGLLFDGADGTKYHSLRIPYQDTWGVLMRKDSPLAGKETVALSDLKGLPLILSRQVHAASFLKEQLGAAAGELWISGTYNLLFNGSLMVEDHLGYAVCLGNIVRVSEDSALCFKALQGAPRAEMNVVWKKHRGFSRAAEQYLEKPMEVIREKDGWEGPVR